MFILNIQCSLDVSWMYFELRNNVIVALRLEMSCVILSLLSENISESAVNNKKLTIFLIIQGKMKFEKHLNHSVKPILY